MEADGDRGVSRSRRRLLAALASAGTVGLAGCGSTPPSAGTPSTDYPSPGGRRTPTQTGTPADATETDTETATPEESTETPGEAAWSPPDPLAVDNSNPFVYVNDQSDNYNAELALAMASREFVDLRGFLFSYPGEQWLNERQFRARREEYETHHLTVHERATRSGFENLPPAEIGVVGARHRRPSSGVVEDTTVLGSAGTDRIVAAAREASPDRPLVVAAGSDLCTVADAYLAEPSIAERTVVFLNWTGSPRDPGYNIWQSGWSASVVLRRIPTVLVGQGAPLLRAEQIRTLPDEPLRAFMLQKEHGQYGSPLRGGQTWDGDSAATLTPAHPETRLSARPVYVDGSVDTPFEATFQAPELEFGEGEEVVHALDEIAGLTDAFWSHFEDPETWS